MPAKKTHEQFIQELYQINPSINVLSNYEGANLNIEVSCKDCGIIWNTSPHSLLTGSGCPECGRNKIYEITRKKHEEFLSEMLIKNPGVEVLGEYVSDKKHITVKCKSCGCVWEGTPCHLIRGHGCPECANRKRSETMKRNRRH